MSVNKITFKNDPSITHNVLSKSTSRIKNVKIENDISISEIIDAEETLKDENSVSSAGDIVCNFDSGNINKSDSSVNVDKVCFFKQEQWNNFIFGFIDCYKYEDHIEDVVDYIITINNLKSVKRISNLQYGCDETEITIFGILKMYHKELYLVSTCGDIRLDLSETKQPLQDLFINQILVVTGATENKLFKVKQMYSNASLPISKILPNFSQGNINLMVAAGPFFSELSPHGKSLKFLIQKVIELEAKLLILLGPIFESEFASHLNKTSTDNFQKCLDDLLEAILKPLFSNANTQNTKLIVLSSWKDAGNYGFYPTPPNIESRLPILFPNNVFMVSDPSVFSVNDIIIAANASDTLLGLHSTVVNNHTRGDIFQKLCKQIISQRSLHPSFTINPIVPVDQLLWMDHCTLQKNTPHIILTSSQLRTFIRVVDDCMVVNVGQLVKFNSQKQSKLGTYGLIQIGPSKNGVWSPQLNISAEIILI